MGKFHLADPDTFELVNFNRQSGATVPNLGRLKTDVARETVLAINPEAEIEVFEQEYPLRRPRTQKEPLGDMAFQNVRQ